jgi:hypothetical protein
LGTRSHTTFKKRQKEQARTEKAREKLEERVQRKLEKGDSGAIIDSESDLDDHSLDVLDVNTRGVDAEEDEEEESKAPAVQYPRSK